MALKIVICLLLLEEYGWCQVENVQFFPPKRDSKCIDLLLFFLKVKRAKRAKAVIFFSPDDESRKYHRKKYDSQKECS